MSAEILPFDAQTERAPDEPTLVVDVEGYEGPLDLLLALIREEEVEITDIPIARICEQFLARIHGLELSDAAEYLEGVERAVVTEIGDEPEYSERRGRAGGGGQVSRTLNSFGV